MLGSFEDELIISHTLCSSLISRNKGGDLMTGSNSNDLWEIATE